MATPSTPAPPERRREKTELITGAVVLALGIALLLASFVIAWGFVSSPGAFVRSQTSGSSGNEPKGPTASFTFSVRGFLINGTSNSQQGDASITSYQWDWGDGPGGSGPTASHTYVGNFSGFVRLTVRDANNRESTAVGNVQAGPDSNYNGNSQADPADLANNIDLGSLFGPIANTLLGVVIVLLVFAGMFVMWLAGASITKAGWNLIKPKPEMIRVRVKPKDLEVEPVYPQAVPAAVPAQAYVPPSQGQDPPPPP